ncbi:MAG: PDZ domain-containing protein [Candidatus Omnitrophica bacterium]|nr:PDZ domain-containing protein [Candidatus Omnitrophota bacterium]
MKEINETSVIFLYDGEDVKINLPKPQPATSGIVVKDTHVKVVPLAQTEKAAVMPEQGSSLVSTSSIPSPVEPKSINLNEITEKLRSDPSLIASVSITPFIKDGAVEGFVVNRIPETGVSAQLGIQPGDIIKRVNGTPIDSLSKAYSVYNTAINSPSRIVTVEIIRDGKPLILTYRLE